MIMSEGEREDLTIPPYTSGALVIIISEMRGEVFFFSKKIEIAYESV